MFPAPSQPIQTVNSKIDHLISVWQTKLDRSESALESKLENFLELWQSKSAQYDSALENRWRTLEDKINITLSKARITEPNPDHLLNDRLKALESNLEKLIHAPNESTYADSKSQQTETRVESAPKSLFSAVVKQSEQPSVSLLSSTPHKKEGPNHVDFIPSNCVVLHNFVNKSLAVNHIAIRQSISKMLDNPVITFLNKFEHDKNEPKLIIQFAKSSSASTLLTKWDSSIEKCDIRRPLKPAPMSDGICFGVPKNISDTVLLEYVKASFPSCEKVIRFLDKNQQTTGTVKRIFKESDHLHNAIEKGIYIQDLCLILRVERARAPKPRPLQCYQCWGYGHTAAKCKSDKICRQCSSKITSENDHKSCGNKKCCNCGSLDHNATSHSDCPMYKKIMQKLTEKILENLRYDCHPMELQ